MGDVRRAYLSMPQDGYRLLGRRSPMKKGAIVNRKFIGELVERNTRHVRKLWTILGTKNFRDNLLHEHVMHILDGPVLEYTATHNISFHWATYSFTNNPNNININHLCIVKIVVQLLVLGRVYWSRCFC
ncbi:hypothetical protein GPALN_010418 [Globodera pallida]|nr:hypothetical protein GPALN_010418 [Globodera pallida]